MLRLSDSKSTQAEKQNGKQVAVIERARDCCMMTAPLANPATRELQAHEAVTARARTHTHETMSPKNIQTVMISVPYFGQHGFSVVVCCWECTRVSYLFSTAATRPPCPCTCTIYRDWTFQSISVQTQEANIQLYHLMDISQKLTSGP